MQRAAVCELLLNVWRRKGGNRSCTCAIRPSGRRSAFVRLRRRLQIASAISGTPQGARYSPRIDLALNKPIPAAILRNLVAASLLFASSMLLARDAENEKAVSFDAWEILKNFRASENALNTARLEQQDNARLLDELIATKKRLSDLRPTVSPPLDRAKTRISGLEPNKPLTSDILDELLKAQEAFALPFNQVAESLFVEQSHSRSPASNQITQSLGSGMYTLLNKRIYTTDMEALKAKIAKSKAVLGDFPTDFMKDGFGNKFREELIAPLDAKIDELKQKAENLDKGAKQLQLNVDKNERDLRERVDSDTLKNLYYYKLGSFGFMSMTAVLLGALISLFFVARNAHFSGLLHDFFRWNPMLDLSTVFILALAIIMLGLNDKLSSEVLGTLLGGISGYVLGRASRAASAAAERAEIKNLLESKPSGDSGPPPAIGAKIEPDKSAPPNL